jgi:hypothetical protein
MEKTRVFMASLGLLLLAGCAVNTPKETTYFGVTLLNETWIKLFVGLFFVVLGLFFWGGAVAIRRIVVSVQARKSPWQRD